jgi:hypothetical protein
MSEETEKTEAVETTVETNSSDKPIVEKTNDGYKLDFSKTKENNDAVQEQSTDEGLLGDIQQGEETKQDPKVGLQEVVEEDKEETVLEEITDTSVEDKTQEFKTTQEVEATEEQVEQINEELDNNPGLELPENVQDLVKFMNETGGSLEDYVRLNADYSSVDDKTLLKEYYKSKKKNLTDDEINFLIEDKFAFNEDIDEEVDIKRKKLAFKEEVGEAREFLNGLKDQYYKEVKLGSKLPPEQQKAIDFFNRYNSDQQKVQELAQKQKQHFINETNKIFNEDFKGFDFNVGEKKFRYNVKDAESVRKQQGDLLNVFGKYIKDNMLQDAGSYHKALFAANNPDAIANHFYEQGRADAVKGMTAEAKNINMDARKTANEYVQAGGVKVRVVGGDSSSKLKMKIKR